MKNPSPTHSLAYLSGLTLPRGLNFDPAADAAAAAAAAAGGAGGAGGAPQPKVTVNIDKSFIDKLVGENKGLDLNTKVKVGDQQLSITDLIAQSQAVGQAQTAAQKAAQDLANLQLSIKSAYDTSDKADLGKAREGMQTVLKTAGVPDDQIAKDLEEMFGEPKPGANGQPANGQVKKVEEPEDLRFKAIVEDVNERIEMSAYAPFEQHPVLKSIVEAKTKLMNEEVKALTLAGKPQEAEAAKKEHDTFLEEWKGQALADLNGRLSARKAKERTFSLKWIKEEGAKTADTIASKLRRATGDPRFLGKAPATAAESPLSVLDRKPVERPKGEYGKTNVADLEQKLDDYGVDKFMRKAAEQEFGKAGSQL